MVISSAFSFGQPPVGVGLAHAADQRRQFVRDGDVHGLLEQILADGQQELIGRQGGSRLPAVHNVAELAHLLAQQVIVGQIEAVERVQVRRPPIRHLEPARPEEFLHATAAA